MIIECIFYATFSAWMPEHGVDPPIKGEEPAPPAIYRQIGQDCCGDRGRILRRAYATESPGAAVPRGCRELSETPWYVKPSPRVAP